MHNYIISIKAHLYKQDCQQLCNIPYVLTLLGFFFFPADGLCLL